MLGAGLEFQSSPGRDQVRRAQKEVNMISQSAHATCHDDDVSNLQRFIAAVTPSLPAQYLSKTTMRGWKTCDVEFQPYFVLGDLWESFKEWSVYGVGVPLVLDKNDSVVQYYVPFLSAIQMYGDPSKSSVKLSRPSEDSDGDYFKDFSSDGSSDSEHDRRPSYFKEICNSNRFESDQTTSSQEDFSSDEGESSNPRGCLLFEYFEGNQPHIRRPLADKLLDLALQFPELKSLRSCDLLSCSWISVAWYPIYRIPTRPTSKDLDACFLTYHSLHTPILGTHFAQNPVVSCLNELDSVPMISLPVFGLASYKLKRSLWTSDGESDQQLLNVLLQDAKKWITLLKVNHPDLLFFSRR